MIKQTYKNKNLLLGLLIACLFVFTFSARVNAATGPDNCYNSYTGWTYECGVGASNKENQQTTSLVLDIYGSSNYTPTKKTATKGFSPTYSFTLGSCYEYETVPMGTYVNRQAWVEQTASDCSNVPALEAATAPNSPLVPDPGAPTVSSSTPESANCVKNEASCNLISQYINPLISFLNVAVGLVVVISIVIGGIQYSTSGDNPEAVQAAKKRIFQALGGLIAYFLLYAFLNFIIPGGV
ncbi:MAG TPA: pilin [Candidatus Saccharimonadia bacterium]|nr:pilin [Candidatus Saccharimonadia bacterium]